MKPTYSLELLSYIIRHRTLLDIVLAIVLAPQYCASMCQRHDTHSGVSIILSTLTKGCLGKVATDLFSSLTYLSPSLLLWALVQKCLCIVALNFSLSEEYCPSFWNSWRVMVPYPVLNITSVWGVGWRRHMEHEFCSLMVLCVSGIHSWGLFTRILLRILLRYCPVYLPIRLFITQNSLAYLSRVKYQWSSVCFHFWTSFDMNI